MRVKAHIRMVKDRGAPGRTPKSKRWFKPKGRLRFKRKDWHAKDPARVRRAILRGVARRDGSTTTIRRLNALRNVTTSNLVKKVAKADMEYLAKLYNY